MWATLLLSAEQRFYQRCFLFRRMHNAQAKIIAKRIHARAQKLFSNLFHQSVPEFGWDVVNVEAQTVNEECLPELHKLRVIFQCSLRGKFHVNGKIRARRQEVALRSARLADFECASS